MDHRMEAAEIAARAWWFYLYKVVWPFGHMFIYPRFSIDGFSPLVYRRPGWHGRWVPALAPVALRPPLSRGLPTCRFRES